MFTTLSLDWKEKRKLNYNRKNGMFTTWGKNEFFVLMFVINISKQQGSQFTLEENNVFQKVKKQLPLAPL